MGGQRGWRAWIYIPESPGVAMLARTQPRLPSLSLRAIHLVLCAYPKNRLPFGCIYGVFKSGASWLAEPSKYHIYGPHIVMPALSRYPVSEVHYPRFDAGFRGTAVWCSINVGFYF